MIVFDLQCENSHKFEGWFEDADSYKRQKEKGLVTCPFCNSIDVEKVPSGFAIKSNNSVSAAQKNGIRDIQKRIAEYVEKNFDNVGTDFAKEALKIHYGVSEPRNIRGISSAEEEKTLQKEGINFLKIPVKEDFEPDLPYN